MKIPIFIATLNEREQLVFAAESIEAARGRLKELGLTAQHLDKLQFATWSQRLQCHIDI